MTSQDRSRTDSTCLRTWGPIRATDQAVPGRLRPLGTCWRLAVHPGATGQLVRILLVKDGDFSQRPRGASPGVSPVRAVTPCVRLPKVTTSPHHPQPHLRRVTRVHTENGTETPPASLRARGRDTSEFRGFWPQRATGNSQGNVAQTVGHPATRQACGHDRQQVEGDRGLQLPRQDRWAAKVLTVVRKHAPEEIRPKHLRQKILESSRF